MRVCVRGGCIYYIILKELTCYVEIYMYMTYMCVCVRYGQIGCFPFGKEDRSSDTQALRRKWAEKTSEALGTVAVVAPVISGLGLSSHSLMIFQILHLKVYFA